MTADIYSTGREIGHQKFPRDNDAYLINTMDNDAASYQCLDGTLSNVIASLVLGKIVVRVK